jgi:hypothetical protein
MEANLGYSLAGVKQLDSENTDVRILAAKAFERAYNHGRISQLISRLFKRSNALSLLGSQPVTTQHSTSRIVSIPIRQIKGTLGRSTDFDLGFNPLNETSRTRWVSIMAATLRGTSLPPVELVKVGSSYYVRDGHHRISVAKYLGQDAIDARIVN